MVLKSLLRKFAAETADPPGTFIARTAAELLEPHRRLLHEIRKLAGVTDRVWDACYAPAYRQYALLVQLLPASEAHHHASPGGLLRHGLEVSLEALRIRQGHLLPPGASPEAISARQDVWTYCCAMGGLLHDVGKPLVDQEIILDDDRTWSMLSGPMPPGVRYRVRFRPGRIHRAHERTTALLAGHVLPAQGCDWIATDPEALLAWLAALGGETEEASLLGQIVARADQISVSRDLARGIPTQTPGARARPLAEVLINGLRELLRGGALPLNRPGAAAYVVGGELWLVSKRVLDALREFLQRDGEGIPHRNERLMDELQQHGLLVANGDRAIWHCEIRDGDWASQLTCLRMPAHLIWPDEGEMPAFSGTVTPVEKHRVTSSTDSSLDSQNMDPEDKEEHQDTANPSSSSVADSPVLPEPPLLETSELPEPPEPITQDTLSASSAPRERSDSSDPSDESSPQPYKSPKNPGEAFVCWLADRIHRGEAKINTVDARIHVVQEGLVLVSPAIFRDFDPVNWRSAQRHFQRLKLHKKLPDETNIWTCIVRKERKSSELKAYLIPDPEERLGVTLPGPNQAVRLQMPDTGT